MLVTSIFFFHNVFITFKDKDYHLTLYHTTLRKKTLENIVGKEENAGNQHFLPFPTVFSTLSKREIIIFATLNLSSANAFNLVTSKILVALFRVKLKCFIIYTV